MHVSSIQIVHCRMNIAHQLSLAPLRLPHKHSLGYLFSVFGEHFIWARFAMGFFRAIKWIQNGNENGNVFASLSFCLLQRSHHHHNSPLSLPSFSTLWMCNYAYSTSVCNRSMICTLYSSTVRFPLLYDAAVIIIITATISKNKSEIALMHMKWRQRAERFQPL